ncbi:gp95 [Bacillus phage W.Ph.]|uniref:Gp95 n=1 Tax=Bacillus phage W.Ph. TaxID=764595 RepID=G9B1J6_9CAUD|nr:gp95 [Bacillus phage W.Ph.]ADH03241.1 gp95 [Bacillus phage W.Ph.]
MKALYIGPKETYRENGVEKVQFQKGHIYQSIKRCHTEWANLTEEEFHKQMDIVDPDLTSSKDGYLIFVGEDGTPAVFDNGYWQKVFYIL